MVTKNKKTAKGTCPKCSKPAKLTQEATINNKKQKVCESCFTDLRQGKLIPDEYDLQPGEMTKAEVADILQCTVRTVENLVKKGAITAEKKRRRINDAVRLQVVFDRESVKEYKAGADKPVNFPQVVAADPASPKTAMQLQQTDQMNMLMQGLGALIQNQSTSRLSDLSGKLYIDVEELAALSGIAKSRLLDAIHGAEKSDHLDRYSGDHGKAVWKCADLDRLLENLPPTPINRRLPPQVKEKAKGANSAD